MSNPEQAMSDETVKYRTHCFKSADGTSYFWDERQETALTLAEEDIVQLRASIEKMPDTVIQNVASGNGIPMGVPVSLTQDKLNDFLDFILNIIKFREKLNVRVTQHAADRLAEDQVLGDGHPDFRGWLSEDDIKHCVCTISHVNGARLTIDRGTLCTDQISFNSPLALEVRGTKLDGKEGTLAIAFITVNRIRIITLL